MFDMIGQKREGQVYLGTGRVLTELMLGLYLKYSVYKAQVLNADFVSVIG